MSQNQVFVTQEIYHVYNRGANGQDIFFSEKDYIRFQRLLLVLNTTKRIEYKTSEQKSLVEIKSGYDQQLVKIHTYVLMKNHFHIMLEQVVDGGISKFMSKLLTSYTMYVNRKYKRSGVLFQGLFKAKHVGTEHIYFDYLFSYIHLNPIKYIEPRWKEGLIGNLPNVLEFLSQYRYSSYLDYKGITRDENTILHAQYKSIENIYGVNPQITVEKWTQMCAIESRV